MARSNREDAARDKRNEQTPKADRTETGPQRQDEDDSRGAMHESGSNGPTRFDDWASI